MKKATEIHRLLDFLSYADKGLQRLQCTYIHTYIHTYIQVQEGLNPDKSLAVVS